MGRQHYTWTEVINMDLAQLRMAYNGGNKPRPKIDGDRPDETIIREAAEYRDAWNQFLIDEYGAIP